MGLGSLEPKFTSRPLRTKNGPFYSPKQTRHFKGKCPILTRKCNNWGKTPKGQMKHSIFTHEVEGGVFEDFSREFPVPTFDPSPRGAG